MFHHARRLFSLGGLAAFSMLLASQTATASAIPVGYVSWDITAPGSSGQFDIVNLTGPNSSGDATFPVTSTLNLGSLGLHVDFADATSEDFGPSYFTANADGISFDGSTIGIGGANPLPVDAILTGLFSPLSLTEFDSSSHSILASFKATILPSGGTTLADGDLAVIYATEGIKGVPEPQSLALFGTGLVGVLLRKRQRLQQIVSSSRRQAAGVALAACALLVPATSWAGIFAVPTVKLNTWTAPDNGVAGVNNVNITGSNFPSGVITAPNVIATFAASCGGPVLATAPGTSLTTILGATKRVNVVLPSSLATGTYFVAISDSAAGDTAFTSSNCSEVRVTHTSAALSACVPTSSLGLNAPVAPGPVTAIVPRGAWAGGATGIRVVQLEGGAVAGLPVSIPTSANVNSCAANPATGKSVCVDNGAGVYILDSLAGGLSTTLTSGSNATAGFSGGSCKNCGVAVNALTNQAIIAMGFTPSASNSALQVLDLATNTFKAPFPVAKEISENISIDPTRGYVLSPNEASNYDLIQFSSATGVLSTEFARAVAPGLTLDSAAEDCTTGIALAVGEFTNTVFLTDLTQATFVPGAPGTWSAPGQEITLVGTSFSAGASAVTVAPGTSHQAIVTGEFGGSSFAVLQLPSTSGSGTPGIVDYAFVSGICGVSAGLDPHTITAYTSPNDGKAYAVMAAGGPPPSQLAVIDMAAVLAQPRDPGTHTVAGGAICTGPLVRFVPVP